MDVAHTVLKKGPIIKYPPPPLSPSFFVSEVLECDAEVEYQKTVR